MMELVSGSELARRLGVSETAVRKHVKRELYRPNKAGLFDVEACTQAWRMNRDPEGVARGLAGAQAVAKEAATGGFGESSLTRARTIQTALKVQREKLAFDREKGLLISRDDALRAGMAVVSLVCERLDGAAAQIGVRVVGLDAVAAERVAREVLANIRKEIAGLADAIVVVPDGKS